ncbi:GH92 family glycosyl hydrolase [Dysgonomonas sp. ZJ279]|uniref:GH92 family glycosyl hydrolase n=1 Tax=Dysgonomonas sp. ZJ279 TaxID=2709796 RepID=UPI0013EA5BFA|nr:GH92 family glycosyl hydrolase [Dysgonomonas sp. ZJ279]
MKNVKKTLLSILVLSSVTMLAQKKTDFVDPFIGTTKMGHTFPGACVPFGGVQLSPDTDTIPHSINGKYQADAYKYCAGYQYEDKTIVGFSHTHLSGTGHSDLGDILIMPTTGELKLNPGTADNTDSGYRSRYSHSTEKATPGYYEVVLDDYKVKAQLTATEHTGIHKYTFPSAQQRIILDMVHGIYNYDGKVLWANLRVENDTLLTGYRITRGWARTNYTYFAISLSKPIKNYGHINKENVPYNGFWRKFDVTKNFPEIGGRGIVAYFDFDDNTDNTLELRVGISAVSTLGAIANLEHDTKGKTFDQLVAQAENKWEKELSVFDVQGSKDQMTMFYTSLYHTMINPSIYMDVDGQYRGLDHNIHKAEGFTNYTVFSLWDTYRALHPLYNIFQRARNTDMVKSMLAHYQQSVHGMLPVWSHMGNENWCMIGYHGVAVVGDAIAKGLPIDKALGLKAMMSSANVPYYDGTKEYLELGYVPYEKSRSGSSITLEYAYDDWVIYNTAKLMNDTKDVDTYRKRALNYENVFDKNIGFARAKLADGKWKEPYSLLNTHDEGFIEGNSWNYSLYVPQDVKGLINQVGGDKKFVTRLDSLFTMHLPDEFFANTEDVTREGLLGNYVHGNEPSHHVAYMYMWTQQPWKTQYWVREIMNKMYRPGIDGLCGNDDCGQMSAWYIFTAMGFYPVTPGSTQYIIGAPYLPSVKLTLESGKVLEIEAKGVSDTNRYIKSLTFNGKPYTKRFIEHADIMSGGKLVFEMTNKPNKSAFSNEPQAIPQSLSK